MSVQSAAKDDAATINRYVRGDAARNSTMGVSNVDQQTRAQQAIALELNLLRTLLDELILTIRNK